MSGSRPQRPERSESEVTGPELRRQDAKELPFREGTMDTIVREAETDPTPEEVVATTVEDSKGQRQGGEQP